MTRPFATQFVAGSALASSAAAITLAGAKPVPDGMTPSDDGAELWARLEPTLTALKVRVRWLDRELIRRGSVPGGDVESFTRSFAELERLLNDTLGDAGGASASARTAVGARVQAEVLPYMLMSEIAERWYSKPRGYAGDFLSIARMYDDEPRGVGRLGPILDRCFLNLAASRAVQNRRGLLAREIGEAVERRPGGGPACVTSLACGPARELFDVYASLPDPSALRSTLVDMDHHALAYVADRRDAARLKAQISLVSENLVYLATRRRTIDLADQDLVYSIGLIDYFSDDIVVRLMDFVHDTLRPGGRAIFGNFHPANPTRAVMDHVLDWKLVHRDEHDMNRLFQASAFGRPCTRILYEEQRINLFAECVKGTGGSQPA